MSDRRVTYGPAGPVSKAFHESDAFARFIMGPLGSGKSTSCVMEILRRSTLQLHSPDGYRRTRWAVVRNTYPELKTTTLKTWMEWCPAQYGRLTQDAPIRHHVKMGDLDMEVYFLALDQPEDAKKLLSLELTGAWFNEIREIPKPVIDAMTGRVGRYPSMAMGGPTWYGLFGDTNPPDDQSWYYRCAEEETPENWQFFRQPGGNDPEAENLQNLVPGYYKNMAAGKDPDWVNVYINANYGYIIEGKPVYPMFKDRIHTAPNIFVPHPGVPLQIGQDYGLTPAAIIGQNLPNGRWLALDELTADGCGVVRFAETLNRYLADQYPEFQTRYDDDLAKRLKLPGHDSPIVGWGDPAGEAKDPNKVDEKSAIQMMNEYSAFHTRPAPSNVFTIRREVVVNALNRMVDGEPGLLISPKCRVLRKGFNGGYHFKTIQSGNSTITHEIPVKNEFSHPHDALQYMLLGGGEHDMVLNRVRRRRSVGQPPRVARDTNYDPLSYNR